MPERQFATPEEAEEAFYDAFANADLEAMMDVWADDDSVVCIHPGAPRLEGREEIRESWRQIFEADAELEFELSDEHYTQDSQLAIHLIRETIGVNDEISGVVLSTNIFQMIDGSWRMILHHASPEPEPEDYDDPVVLH